MADGQDSGAVGSATPTSSDYVTKPTGQGGLPSSAAGLDQTTRLTTPDATTANDLEVTTAKDGKLPINQASPAPADPQLASGAASQPNNGAVATSSETTIAVTEKDLAQTTASTTNDDLAEQIEVLAGEIQALEAKIDRLTGNITVSLPNQPSLPNPAAHAQLPRYDNPTKFPPPSPKLPVITTAPDKPKLTTSTAINDIYSQVTVREQEAEREHVQNLPTAEKVSQPENGSPIGTIGLVLLIFGTITLLILLVSPLFRDMIAISIWQLIRSVGWPTVLSTLGLGLLLSLFSHGRAILKTLMVFFLLLAAIIYLGINNYDYLFGPLQGSLSQIFEFYR